MPQALPLWALPGGLASAAAGSLGFSALTALKIGVIVQRVATLGGLYAVSSLLAPRPPKPQAQVFELRQARPLAPEIIGKAAAAGVVTWARQSSVDSHADWREIVISRGPLHAIGQVWLDDVETVAGTGDAVLDPGAPGEGSNDSGRYILKGVPLVTLRRYLGAADQTHDALLIAAFPDDLDDNFRARGWAKVTVRSGNVAPGRVSQCYPSSWPAVRVLATSKGFDPRGVDDPADPATWTGVASNAAVAYLSVLLSRFPRIDPATVLTAAARAEWSTVANDCDASASDGAGGTEPAWQYGRYVQDDVDPADLLQSIVDAADFRPYVRPDGGLGVMRAVYVAPSGSPIGAAEIIQTRMGWGDTAESKFSRLTASFTDPGNQWTTQAVPTDAVDATVEASIGVRRDDLGEIYTFSLAQTAEVMARAIARRNAVAGSLVCAASAARKWGQRYIEAYLAPYGAVRTVEVTGFLPDLARHRVLIEYLELGAVAHDRATDTGPRPPVEGAVAIVTAAPTDVTVALLEDGGTRRLQVGWRSLIADIADFEIRWASASGSDALGQTLYGAWTLARMEDAPIDAAAGTTAAGPRYVAEVDVPAVGVRVQVRALAVAGPSAWAPVDPAVAAVVDVDMTGGDPSWIGPWIGYLTPATVPAAGLTEARASTAWTVSADEETITAFVSGAPRLTDGGLLRESALTLPATARDPGLLPQGVTVGVATVLGCTRTITAVDIPGASTTGSGYRVQITGTPTGSGTLYSLQGADLAIAGVRHTATSGQSWAFRSYVQVDKLDGATANSQVSYLSSRNGVAQVSAFALGKTADGVGRWDSLVATLTGTVDGVWAATFIGGAAGVAVDIDFTIGAFNAYPADAVSSPIVSGTIRAADDASLAIPDGADGDRIVLTIDAADTTIVRSDLPSRTAVPLAAGALDGEAGVPVGGLAAGLLTRVQVLEPA